MHRYSVDCGIYTGVIKADTPYLAAIRSLIQWGAMTDFSMVLVVSKEGEDERYFHTPYLLSQLRKFRKPSVASPRLLVI